MNVTPVDILPATGCWWPEHGVMVLRLGVDVPLLADRPPLQIAASIDPEYDSCPYWQRYSGQPGADPDGICESGCHDEPACVTSRWPRTVVTHRSTDYEVADVVDGGTYVGGVALPLVAKFPATGGCVIWHSESSAEDVTDEPWAADLTPGSVVIRGTFTALEPEPVPRDLPEGELSR